MWTVITIVILVLVVGGLVWAVAATWVEENKGTAIILVIVIIVILSVMFG
jgi:hypothetical protein